MAADESARVVALAAPRFRLRTLLILTTALNLLLGLAVVLGLESELHIIIGFPLLLLYGFFMAMEGILVVIFLMLFQISLTWLLTRLTECQEEPCSEKGTSVEESASNIETWNIFNFTVPSCSGTARAVRQRRSKLLIRRRACALPLQKAPRTGTVIMNIFPSLIHFG